MHTGAMKVAAALLVVLTVIACKSAAAPPPPTNVADPVATAAPADAAAADDPPGEPPEPPPPCDAWLPHWPAGNHDRVAFMDEKTELWGYKTKAGAIVLPAQYLSASEFWPGGFAEVVIRDASGSAPSKPWRWIDPSGKVIAIAYPFDNGADYYQDGFFRVIDARGRLGFMNDRGQIVIPPQYDFAWQFCNGAAKIEHAGQTFHVNAANQRVPAPPPPP